MPAHINPNLIELAQTIVHTLATHRARCRLVEAIDSYKFVRFLVRADASTRIASIKELDECLWASLGAKIPELEKLPLISQIKGGLIAIDVPKPKSLWRTAYFRDFINEVDDPLGFESPLIATIGIDLGGNLVGLNLSDALCHLLIGGITRGGKSEFALSVLSDIIWRYKPNRVKLALSDIQQVTFEPFINIPHLFAPVAKSVRETIELLQAVEQEMDSRGSLFVKVGAKKLAEYNLRVTPGKQLPQILVYVEEIADCMLSEILVTNPQGEDVKASSEMVRLEQRFSQVGGKWGINYFGSTQSPRKEVIPPLIRSNFPAQLAFMVSRPEESSIILGSSDRDAVNLLGYGDAILRTPTGSDRIQTLLLEPDELTRIIEQIIARWGGFHYEEESNPSGDDGLDLVRKRLEFTVTLPFSVPSNPSVSTNPSVPSDKEAEDSDWGIFLQIREGRKGELVNGRKSRKSKTQLCQELFGIKGDGGNSMKRALEEYDRIRDKFVVPWIRELIHARTPKWEIIEEIYSLSRLKQPKFKKSKPEEWANISTLIDAIASEIEYELDDDPADSTDTSEKEEE